MKSVKLIYFGIRVSNLKRSFRFYTKILGMKVVHRGVMRHGGVFVHLKYPGSMQRLELNYYPPKNQFYTKYRAGTEMDHLGFWAKDVDKVYRELTRKGAKSATRPFTNGGERLAYIKDPDGIWIEFFGPAK